MANANTTQTAAQTALVSISGNPRTDPWHPDAIEVA